MWLPYKEELHWPDNAKNHFAIHFSISLSMEIRGSYLKCNLFALFKAHTHKLICSARKSTFNIFPLLLKYWAFTFLSSLSLAPGQAMLCCFGWSYCPFKPVLKDTGSDMWHQYSLTIPAYMKDSHESWALQITTDLLLLSLITTARSRGTWKAVWGLVWKTSCLRRNCLLWYLMGPFYNNREKYGLKIEAKQDCKIYTDVVMRKKKM